MSRSSDGSQSPPWASRWLWAAGIYNLTWGTLAIAWPHLLFDLTGAERINYPEIWQCVGMIVGVYGIGYIIAASDSRTHWPIVLVGLLGKVFGPRQKRAKKGTIYFFRGRPRGRSDDSRPRAVAVRRAQASVPNGVPRFTHCRRRSSSASVCVPFT
jgi:hypothetical protein